MAIDYIEFESENENDRFDSEDNNKAVAVKAMNAWLERNKAVRVISIETMEYNLPSTMLQSGGYSFDGFRVWFEIESL
jgi:hypothetical protein